MALRFETARFEAAYGTAEQLPPSTTPEVAFAGRSNVGSKSATAVAIAIPPFNYSDLTATQS